MVRHETRIRRSFSPVYLAILSGVLLIILIINGFLEINRAKQGFFQLLERESLVLLQHFERNVQEVMASLQKNQPLSGLLLGLEDSVIEYLLGLAYRVDQTDSDAPLALSDLQSFAEQYGISSVRIYEANGDLVGSWPPQFSPFKEGPLLKDLINKKRSVAIDLFSMPLSEKQIFSLAILRKEALGIVLLQVNGEQLKRIFLQLAVQRVISDIGLREDILFVSIQDANLNSLAHLGRNIESSNEEVSFLKDTFRGGRPLFRLYPSGKTGEIFEAAKAITFKGNPMGLVRIGYSPKEIHPVLSQIKKNVVLSIFFFLILGVSAITLIWVNQNRHLRKMKEMEDRIQLAERLSSLGHLAAGVAHEIRNPLNAMGMGLQRLKREFLPLDESKKEEYISFTELILKEIRRVNEIIEQFLTLSRPFQLNLKSSSLQELLKNLIILFREEASSQKISLLTEIDSELPFIQVDEERLTQAFINIMKNGIQAMHKGGVFRIGAHSFENRIEVTLSDSGSGIPPDQMEKIFNYYYTTKQGGVGLGLPIAHRIIEAHRGQLKIESQVSVGTRVTVILPL